MYKMAVRQGLLPSGREKGNSLVQGVQVVEELVFFSRQFIFCIFEVAVDADNLAADDPQFILRKGIPRFRQLVPACFYGKVLEFGDGIRQSAGYQVKQDSDQGKCQGDKEDEIPFRLEEVADLDIVKNRRTDVVCRKLFGVVVIFFMCCVRNTDD